MANQDAADRRFEKSLFTLCDPAPLRGLELIIRAHQMFIQTILRSGLEIELSTGQNSQVSSVETSISRPLSRSNFLFE